MDQNQKVIYDEPQIERKINHQTTGVFDRISLYEFLQHSESTPGGTVDRTEIKTHFHLDGVAGFFEFPGFIGSELVGQKVSFEDIEEIATTYFDPERKANNPAWRIGKREITRIWQINSLEDAAALKHQPSYKSVQTSQ